MKYTVQIFDVRTGRMLEEQYLKSKPAAKKIAANINKSSRNSGLWAKARGEKADSHRRLRA